MPRRRVNLDQKKALKTQKKVNNGFQIPILEQEDQVMAGRIKKVVFGVQLGKVVELTVDHIGMYSFQEEAISMYDQKINNLL